MKKLLIIILPVLLSGCSAFNQLVERMENAGVDFAKSIARYPDGIYVFWSKGDEATVYNRDRIVLNNCQLQNPQR